MNGVDIGTWPSLKCIYIDNHFGDFASCGFGWVSPWMKRQKQVSAFIVVGLKTTHQLTSKDKCVAEDRRSPMTCSSHRRQV
jgi:hypothetical protein